MNASVRALEIAADRALTLAAFAATVELDRGRRHEP